MTRDLEALHAEAVARIEFAALALADAGDAVADLADAIRKEGTP